MMRAKEHLGSGSEVALDLDSQEAPSAKPSLPDVFAPPPDADGEKEKQVGTGGHFAHVPLNKIEELDVSQQLLAGTIDLALVVSEARLKTEDIRRMARDSSPKAGVSRWEELTEALDGISPLEPSLESRTDFSKWLSDSIADLGRSREEAGLEAQRIVDQLLRPSGQLEQRDKNAILKALRKLRKALDVCAGACDRESRTHLGKIEQRVQFILEPFEEQLESSTGRSVSKDPDSEEKWDQTPPPAVPDRKLSTESSNGDLEQQKERSGDPWTGMP